MRLLSLTKDGKLISTEFIADEVPPYAVLSHTWFADEEEVTHLDIQIDQEKAKTKAGYSKIQFCLDRSLQDGLKHFWIDTCCIDKSSSAELSEAINSMFQWYQDAEKCYVYLADVSAPTAEEPVDFRHSRWFTRGFTLQELLAPRAVEFYSKDGSFLGDKASLEGHIHAITGIPPKALRGADLMSFGRETKFEWASTRSTKRPEDAAYSLLGIFGIFMPLIYGEGKQRAMRRLKREIRETTAIPTGPELYEAVREGRLSTVENLIDLGASVNYVFPSGTMETMLHIAVRNGTNAVLDALLETGPLPDIFSADGITPLMLAAVLGNEFAVGRLLAAGYDPEMRLRPTRKTPVQGIDVNDMVDEGSTALLLAARNARRGIVQLLIEQGAKVNVSTTSGFTPLMAACFPNDSAHCVRLLLQAGAHVDAKGPDDFCAHLYCGAFGHIRCAKLLLDAGADIEWRKSFGQTTLHEAIWNQQVAFIRFIVEYGADVEARTAWWDDYEGARWLHLSVQWAEKPGGLEVIRTLIELGADLEAVTDHGLTAAQLAAKEGKEAALEILQKAEERKRSSLSA